MDFLSKKMKSIHSVFVHLCFTRILSAECALPGCEGGLSLSPRRCLQWVCPLSAPALSRLAWPGLTAGAFCFEQQQQRLRGGSVTLCWLVSFSRISTPTVTSDSVLISASSTVSSIAPCQFLATTSWWTLASIGRSLVSGPWSHIRSSSRILSLILSLIPTAASLHSSQLSQYLK